MNLGTETFHTLSWCTLNKFAACCINILKILFCFWLWYYEGFPGGSAIKNLPAMQEPWVRSLSREDPLEEGIATHSSTLAWKIPWMEEPGRLQSMELLRGGHDWTTSLSFFTFMHWRRKWQPTPVFLPGESQGRGSLVGCLLWSRTESDTTEVT